MDEIWFNEYDTKHYSLENKLINYNKSIIQKAKLKEEWANEYIIKEMQIHYGVD
jgi:hypothetical protein